ncbi:response regulator [Thalassorhabdomicrobium marinisediminis]|uniref:response regulator n=1 Tax=Thalassorhabdomicrobium marinisediminis TaxID=2170577 RepID=UPI0024928893|nr:response regulator [Thalassorhabdomicrobium marinisediminis]
MHILAVDDDPIILDLLTHFIEDMPEHTVTTALSVTDALGLMVKPEQPFDCFLLDIVMPGTDGIELCKILRGTDRYRATPILMLTAMADKGHIDSAFAAGASDYITKPFELNSLKGRLSLVEQIAREQREPTSQTYATQALLGMSPDDLADEMTIDLHQPLPIYDVEGVIENSAMENYVTQLSRKSLCGSVVMAFTIRHIADLHACLSPYDFTCVVTDVSEAIADCLLPTHRLVSYAGNGTFVCVVEGAAQIDMERLVDHINLYINAMELSASDGTALNIRVCAGRPARLIWRKGDSAIDALHQAHISAEEAADRLTRDMGSIWTVSHSVA